MPALTPRAMPVRENNSALLHVLEAYIETLKPRRRHHHGHRSRAASWRFRLSFSAFRLMIEPPGPIRGEGLLDAFAAPQDMPEAAELLQKLLSASPAPTRP